MARILLTGGSGRLGRALRPLLSDCAAPPRSELDVCEASHWRRALQRYQPEVVVHAAAFTDVAAAETQRQHCHALNVQATQTMVGQLNKTGLRLVYISTDYVFAGTRGNYREQDPLGPTCNYYAQTKLLAERVVRDYENHLVLRTSFRENWPHPRAFVDVFTGQDYLDVLAPDLALVLEHVDQVPYHTLHLVTERKSFFELARRRCPQVQAGFQA